MRTPEQSREREEKLRSLHTMILRHRQSGGFCQCDGQPWPCDFKRLSNFFKGWESKITYLDEWRAGR